MIRHWALIIEDSPDIAEIFRMAFQKHSFDVDIVWDGPSALSRLEESVPDVVVLDLHLPRISGLDILRYIRSTAELANTFVIVTSADPFLAGKARDEANVVLVKPITYGQVCELAAQFQVRQQNSE